MKKSLKSKNICHPGEVFTKYSWPNSGTSIAPKCAAHQCPGLVGIQSVQKLCYVSSTDVHQAWEIACKPPSLKMLCITSNFSTGVSLAVFPALCQRIFLEWKHPYKRNIESFIATQTEWLIAVADSIEQNLETSNKKIKLSGDMLSL